jgi:hypothetical protein
MEYKYDLFISLGSVCSIAHTLRNLKLRTSSGPFDWYVSNLSKIHDAFKNDFKKYFDLNNITIDNSNNGYSKDKDNNMLWFHLPKYQELKDNNETYINTLNTINRRCERLLTNCRSNKSILFIRKHQNETTNDMVEIENLIRYKFPKLNFKILLINNIKKCDKVKNIIHQYLDINAFPVLPRGNGYINEKYCFNTMEYLFKKYSKN